MRPVHGGCWWALVVAIVSAVGSSLVWAGPASAETTLQVDAGYAGAFVPGQQLPVRVGVSADRLVRGSLEVAVGDSSNAPPVAMAVEVPGGGQKQFLLTVGTGLNPNAEVTARLRQDDRLLASGRATVQSSTDTELVGLLPGALRGRPVPGPAPLAVDAGTARFTAIGEAELEQAPGSLAPLSTLAADADELMRLSPGARGGVLRWVAGGGRLLVDTAPGQPVPGLPDAWQPGARGRAAADLGEVVVADGAIAAGRWSGLVEPSGWGVSSMRFAGDLPIATSLANDAGLRTPELGWLVGFLVVYVLAVGPALFFAVRRRSRPELAWVAVPLVAVLFSTGSYVVGRNLRNATNLVHGTVISSGPAGAVATTHVGVFSRSGETVRVGFPAGWSSGSTAEFTRSTATPNLVTRTPDGPDARLPLDAGQFGLVQGSGPLPGASGLEVSASTQANGRITGTLRNPTAVALEEVAVFAGSAATPLGSLGPGEQRTFELAGGVLGRGDGAEFRVWGGMRPGQSDRAADYGLWQSALRTGGSNFLAPGAVVAAGWTRELSPEVRVDGRAQRPKGRTLVVGRQQVTMGNAASLDGAVRRDVVRDPFVSRFGPRGGNPSSIVRFVLPDGVDASKLVLKSPFGAAELWTDGAWRATTCQGNNCRAFDPGGASNVGIACPADGPCPVPPQAIVRGFPVGGEFAVPAASVRNGVVYARVPGPASFDQGSPLTIGRSA